MKTYSLSAEAAFHWNNRLADLLAVFSEIKRMSASVKSRFQNIGETRHSHPKPTVEANREGQLVLLVSYRLRCCKRHWLALLKPEITIDWKTLPPCAVSIFCIQVWRGRRDLFIFLFHFGQFSHLKMKAVILKHLFCRDVV